MGKVLLVEHGPLDGAVTGGLARGGWAAAGNHEVMGGVLGKKLGGVGTPLSGRRWRLAESATTTAGVVMATYRKKEEA
ncbi:hypothetical protein [Actinomadura sp. GTD37]|uniref:hypothetical protein n=1 Tax=Actinomadura sp. GTD37 TaxID=1778030 RepID=UPI0035BED9E8